MIRSVGNIILISLIWLSSWIEAAIIDKPDIESPKIGEVVQGSVTITGSTDLIGFQSYEIYFAYAIDETDTWFLIHQSNEAVNNGTLGVWDTTTITDGNYRLMVRVNLDDSSTSETIVTGLKVRNYTPIETNTPAPPSIVEGAGETQVVETSSNEIDTEELPSNPAFISSKGVLRSIVIAILFSVLVLVVIGGLIVFRTISRRK